MPRVAKQTEEKSHVTPEPVEGISTVLVELPISEPINTSFPIHVDLQLTKDVGVALRRIARAYDRQQATLESGVRVVTPTQALRKILETIAADVA